MDKNWMTPQDRWQEKNGYKVKGFKLKKDLIRDFEQTCQKNNESQAEVISRYMKDYLQRTSK